MAQLMRRIRPSALRGISGLTAALMLGGCAQTGDILPANILASAEPEKTQATDQPTSGLNALQKATTYWGQQYAKDPRSAENALSYAKNLKALGEKQKAIAVLQRSFTIHGDNREIAGEYGRLALELGQVGTADKILAFADDATQPDWRIISARGTVLAKQGQYKAAIPFYERALQLSPDQPSVLNNLAMAQTMSGAPQQAEELLRKAENQPSAKNEKIRQNLALVLGLQGRYDEAKSVTAGMPDAEATAENVALVRNIVKLPPQASAATAMAGAAPSADAKVATAPEAESHGNQPALKPSAVENTKAAALWETSVASTAP